MIDPDTTTPETLNVLLIGDETAARHELAASLIAANCRVDAVADAEGAIARLENATKSLILLIDSPHCSAIARAVRHSEGPGSAAPILLVTPRTTTPSQAVPTAIDATLEPPCHAQSLARALEPWRSPSLAATRRLLEVFSREEVGRMIEGLADRLRAALAGDTCDRDVAHGVAGLCGTLGFGAAHAAWLALSEGDESALADVRRTSRLALAAIARGI